MQQRKSTPRCGREGGVAKLCCGEGLRRNVSVLCRNVSVLRCGEGLHRNVSVLRHGVALFTDMCFSHVLLFRYSEDLSIGLMRTI